MNRETLNKCPSCGSNNLGNFRTVKEYLPAHAGETFRISQCADCSLTFLQERIPEHDIADYYPRDYQPFNANYNYVSELFLKLRANREIRRFKKLNPNIRTVLDIGCAWGKYMHELRIRGGFEVMGVETDERMCAIGKTKLNLDIKCGDIFSQKFPNDHFDLIVLSHVIEHVYNPKAFLHEVHRILSPKGLVYIKTPNIRTLERIIFKHYWYPYEAPRHIMFFSKKTLTGMLENTGFSIRNLWYEKTPNNIILSLRNFLVEKKLPKWIAKHVSIDNYVLLAICSPLSFILGTLHTSGRMVLIGRKETNQ